MGEVLLFSVGSVRCAIPLNDTSEVLRIVHSEPSGKEAPPWDGGTINLHGSLVPVIVLRALFGLTIPAPAPSEMLIIARAGERITALRVDTISGTLKQPPVPDNPATVADDWPLLPGTYVSSEGIIVIPEISVLLNALGGTDPGSFIPPLPDVTRLADSCDPLQLPEQESPPDAVSVEMLLEERARILAHPVEHLPETKSINVLKFSLAGQELGIPLSAVREVVLTGKITRVPGTPAYIAGICIIRGEIISLVDLRVLLPITHTGITDLNRVIVISDNNLIMGLLADRITGLEDLDAALVTHAREESDPVNLLITTAKPGTLTLLNTDVLFSDPRLVIDES